MRRLETQIWVAGECIHESSNCIKTNALMNGNEPNADVDVIRLAVMIHVIFIDTIQRILRRVDWLYEVEMLFQRITWTVYLVAELDHDESRNVPAVQVF